MSVDSKKFDKEAHYPDCLCCHDTGIQGGVDWPAGFCLCPAGAARQAKEPDAAAKANEVRIKVRGPYA